MAKRGAEEQITKDNVNFADVSEESQGPTLATADVMATRKILKPRGKSHTGVKSSSKFSLTSASGVTPSSSESNIDKNLRLSALNHRFVEAINSVDNNVALADYRPIVQKYIDYYDTIENGNMETSLSKNSPQKIKFPASSTQGLGQQTIPTQIETTQAEKKNPFANIVSVQSTSSPKIDQLGSREANVVDSHDSESDGEQRKQIMIDGPKFTMSAQPTMKKSPFTFGSKPVKKVSEDSSDSEIEIKGPSFTFNKPILDPIFKLGDANNKVNKESKNHAFSFGLSVAAKALRKELDTSSKTDTGATKPFNFEFKSAPAFNVQNGTEKTSDNPSLASIETKESTTGSKSSFLFGTLHGSNDTNPKFLFGSNSQGLTENKPSDMLGSHESSNVKSGFQFGSSNSNSSLPTSKFLFGQNTSSTETSLPFSFGAPKNEVVGKPLFEFTSTKNTNDSSLLNASKHGVDAPISFAPTTTSTLPFDKKASSFVTGSQSDASASSPKDAELMPEEETGRDFAPVATLGTEKVGNSESYEKDEKVLFQRKSKLMLLDTKNKENPYKNLGVGELKVLKNDNGKARILMRADGGLRVLFNVALLKDITYSTMGNGSLVRVPAVNSEGSLETYVLKVKTPSDGKELCDTLNQAKC